MVKFTTFAAASLAVLASASVASAHEGHEESSSGSHHAEVVAGECNSTIGASVIAVVENVTYFDTCVSGKTFAFTSIFDASKLSASDFFTFCNSSACLAPMHTVMHNAPLTCLITYKGSAQNLTGEITELHDKCHEVKDAAKTATSSSGNNTSAGTVTTPAPTTSAATSVNSKALAVALAGVVGVASFLF